MPVNYSHLVASCQFTAVDPVTYICFFFLKVLKLGSVQTSNFSYATSTFPIIHLICPPKILHKLCFSFLLGITAVPREIENNAYAKFWGANNVRYGKCGNSVIPTKKSMKRSTFESIKSHISNLARPMNLVGVARMGILTKERLCFIH